MKPYGLKKGGSPASKDLDCCPGHTEYPVQSKHSRKVGGRKSGRRSSKKRERQLARVECKMWQIDR